eukprot:SAG11_NODE_161_length_14021_cov_36.845065_8_plen_74_part_00
MVNSIRTKLVVVTKLAFWAQFTTQLIVVPRAMLRGEMQARPSRELRQLSALLGSLENALSGSGALYNNSVGTY